MRVDHTRLHHAQVDKVSNRVDVSLRFKITNSLKNADYERLAEFTKEHAGFSIAVLPGMGFEHVSISPVTVAVEGFGFRIDAETSFTEPVGFELSDSLGLEKETQACVTINRRGFRLSKIVTDQAGLDGDLNGILGIIERVINRVCAMFGTRVERMVTLDSESLDAQLDVTRKRDELEKRGEIPRPFGTIHAEGSRDAKDRAGGLIPLYKERDKAYLYDAKQVYYLLPHDFVVSLLRCDATTLVRQEEFDSRGRDVLRDMVYRKHLKKRELFDGTVCYYGLDEKTQRYLKGHLEHRTPRR